MMPRFPPTSISPGPQTPVTDPLRLVHERDEEIRKLHEEQTRLYRKIGAQKVWIEKATTMLAAAEKAIQGVGAILAERDRLKADLSAVKVRTSFRVC